MKFGMLEALEELAQKSGRSQGYGIELTDGRSVALLLNFAPEFNKKANISELVNKAKDIFKQYFTFTVGVGETCDNIDIIHESFLQANRAVYYRFIKGKDNVIFYEDIKENQKNKYRYPAKLESMLTMAIKQGKGDEIEKTADEIKEYIMGQSISIESVQCIYFGIINAVMKTLDEMEIDSSKYFVGTEESLFIEPYETIDNLLERIAEFCRGVCRYIMEQKESKNYQLRDKILEILKNNYHDSMLSLESIAGECGMSPSYISRFFKDHIGCSPTQYLDALRMEEARELLKTTRQNLKEIVDKVGYVNETNFIRKFKKLEGMTPMQYRNITQPGDAKAD
jgi:AraC-like DNA-binding protein